MLRTEQGHQRHIRRVFEQVNRRLAIPIVASVIGDEAEALAFEWSEMILCKHVNAVENLRLPSLTRCLPFGRSHFRSTRFERSGDSNKIEVVDSLRRQRTQLGAQGADVSLLGRMIA